MCLGTRGTIRSGLSGLGVWFVGFRVSGILTSRLLVESVQDVLGHRDSGFGLRV